MNVLSSSLDFISHLLRYILTGSIRTGSLENHHSRLQHKRASQRIRRCHLRMSTRSDEHNDENNDETEGKATKKVYN
jgi:hypothetical protein